MTQRLLAHLATALSAVSLFAINAYICWGLFGVEFTKRMESIESSYMSISRWAVDHWSDLMWFPLWFTGTTFRRVYQPGLHLSVAALAKSVGWTPQHAYHFLTAAAYCLGPVALFWLCYRATGRRGFGFFAGVLYSLVSPVCFLVRAVAADAGGFFSPRRFQVLVHYGEGPHTTAVALLPLVIWLVDLAVSRRRQWLLYPAAALGLAAVVLTNWPGSVGLAMALAAYCVSRLQSERRIYWPALLGVGIVAYLIACPWIPPSIVRAVLTNAQRSDNTMLGRRQLLLLSLLVVGTVLLQVLFRHWKITSWIRFFLYFALIAGAVSVGREWFGWSLLPQPNRFQLELDMAVAAIAAYGAALIWDRLPRGFRLAAVSVMALLCLAQVQRYHRLATRLIQPIYIQSTIEYKMARAFESRVGNERVFAPGNVSLWMNMFTDVPQVEGCCEQGTPNNEYRIAAYTIYTGQNAGARDAEISLLWLKAYGAGAIGITGPASTEYFKPFWNPRKFDGVLPELWREGDNAIYRVPRRSSSLAHVIDRSALVTRPPENGLDTGQLEKLVAQLDDPGKPAAYFHWLTLRTSQIRADVSPGQVIFVQVTYDPGWRAMEGSVPRPIVPDALGLMAIVPGHPGSCDITLSYNVTKEERIASAAQMLGAAALAMCLVIGWHRWRSSVSNGV